MTKYLYKNLVYKYNGFCWVVFYRHPCGKLEKLTWKNKKADAIKAGKMQLDYINKKTEVQKNDK